MVTKDIMDVMRTLLHMDATEDTVIEFIVKLADMRGFNSAYHKNIFRRTCIKAYHNETLEGILDQMTDDGYEFDDIKKHLDSELDRMLGLLEPKIRELEQIKKDAHDAFSIMFNQRN